MKNAILIHGCCSKEDFFKTSDHSMTNSHWFPWVKEQLIKQSIETHMPEMPTPYEPNYGEWKEAFGRFNVGKETILIGHSCGAGFLLRWLGENKVTVDKLILVAPWLGVKGEKNDFLHFKLKPAIQERVKEMHLFYSSDDNTKGVKEAIDEIAKSFPEIKTHFFNNKGHFTHNGMGTDEFAEIMEVL